jgi:hypothetical protein
MSRRAEEARGRPSSRKRERSERPLSPHATRRKERSHSRPRKERSPSPPRKKSRNKDKSVPVRRRRKHKKKEGKKYTRHSPAVARLIPRRESPRSPVQHDASDPRHDADTNRKRRYQYRSDIYKHKVNRGLCCQDTLRFALKLLDVFKVEDHKMVHKVVAQPYEVRRLLMQKGIAGNHPGFWISLANSFHANWVGNNPGRVEDKWKCGACGSWTYAQWDCCFVCAALREGPPDATANQAGKPDDPSDQNPGKPVDKGEAN